MHVELQNRLDVGSLLTIWCHKNCVCSYVSLQRLDRHLKRQGNETNTNLDVPKRQQRSDISSFKFFGTLSVLWTPVQYWARFEESGTLKASCVIRNN